MRLVVQPRHDARPLFPGMVLVGSVAAGFVAVGLIFAASGVDPFYATWRILSGSFGSVFGIKETVAKAIPRSEERRGGKEGRSRWVPVH